MFLKEGVPGITVTGITCYFTIFVLVYDLLSDICATQAVVYSSSTGAFDPSANNIGN